jgi:hypothetical protein
MEYMFDVIGIIGVVLILTAYFLLEQEILTPHQLVYLFLNLFGALFIIVSLIHAWNLSAFVVEAAWALISIYGIIKALKHKAKS